MSRIISTATETSVWLNVLTYVWMTNDDDFTQSGQSGVALFGPLVADVASSRRTRLLDHCSTDHPAAVTGTRLVVSSVRPVTDTECERTEFTSVWRNNYSFKHRWKHINKEYKIFLNNIYDAKIDKENKLTTG